MEENGIFSGKAGKWQGFVGENIIFVSIWRYPKRRWRNIGGWKNQGAGQYDNGQKVAGQGKTFHGRYYGNLFGGKIKSPLCFCGQYVTLGLSRIVLFSRISTRFLIGFVCWNKWQNIFLDKFLADKKTE